RSVLAMSPDEARVLLAEDRSDEQDAILGLADGWPALIALVIHSRGPSTAHDAVPEELYSYFAEELYQAAPRDLQQELRRLALAPYVTPDIAETISGERADDVIRQGIDLGFFAT